MSDSVHEKQIQIYNELINKVEANKIQRKKVLESLKDFYTRLPDIKNVEVLLTEFKAHNDELIDYILELSDIVNWTLNRLEARW